MYSQLNDEIRENAFKAFGKCRSYYNPLCGMYGYAFDALNIPNKDTASP